METKILSSLSPRLEYVASQFLPNLPVWDFCCDHGYLGIWALKKAYPEVHFVDPASHLIDAIETKAKIFENENKGRIYFHRALGQDLSEPVRGNLAILGVGPYVIKDILEGLWQKQLLKPSRLVLGPQRNPEKLDTWILGWQKNHALTQVTKKILLEKGRERVIFTLDFHNEISSDATDKKET